MSPARPQAGVPGESHPHCGARTGESGSRGHAAGGVESTEHAPGKGSRRGGARGGSTAPGGRQGPKQELGPPRAPGTLQRRAELVIAPSWSARAARAAAGVRIV